MATFFIALFSVILVLVCFFVTLLVLMQKPSANSGMGAALGGGAAEQAFGGEAGNVLTKGTIYAIIAFFVLSFVLYLATLATVDRQAEDTGGASITKIEGDQPAEAAPPAEGSVMGPEGPEGESAPGAGSVDGDDTDAGAPVEEPSVEGEPSTDEAPTEEAVPLNLEELDLDATKPADNS